MTPQNHITLLGILHIARGAFALLIGMAVFGILTGIGVIADDETAVSVLGAIGGVIMMILTVLSIPSIVAGIGVLLRREWGRITALVIGVLSLVDIPIGTAVGVYTLWVCLNDDCRALFPGAPSLPVPVALPVVQS
jgi:hypothetical protein